MDVQAIAFEIISAAGDSFSDVMVALSEAHSKNFKEAKSLLAAAEEKLLEAHKAHSQLLFDFASGKEIPLDILLVHAQDHLTKAEVMVTIVSELVSLNEKIG